MPPRKRKPAVSTGLEIDDVTVRIAQLTQSEGGAIISALAEAELPVDAFDDGTPEDPRAVGKIVRALVKERELSIRNAHINTSNTHSVLRVIPSPAGVEKENLEKVMDYQLKEELPISDEEAEIRWEAIEDDTGDLRIIAGGVRKPHVAAIMSTVSSAGLRAASLEPRALSVMRFAGAFEEDAELLVDVGARSSSVVARTGSMLVMNSISDIGALQIAEEGNPAAHKLLSQMDDVLSYVVANIGPNIRIALTGWGPSSTTLKELVRKHFNRDVHTVTSDRVDTTDVLSSVDINLYAVSLGLALKGLS